MVDKHWDEEASDLVKKILKADNKTQTDAAVSLNITQSSLGYKLSKGTLRVPEFLKLLEVCGCTMLLFNSKGDLLDDETFRDQRLQKIQAEIEALEEQIEDLRSDYFVIENTKGKKRND